MKSLLFLVVLKFVFVSSVFVDNKLEEAGRIFVDLDLKEFVLKHVQENNEHV